MKVTERPRGRLQWVLAALGVLSLLVLNYNPPEVRDEVLRLADMGQAVAPDARIVERNNSVTTIGRASHLQVFTSTAECRQLAGAYARTFGAIGFVEARGTGRGSTPLEFVWTRGKYRVTLTCPGEGDDSYVFVVKWNRAAMSCGG